ncbi:uncharacterized protein TNCV_1562941 [Trichonephila clavipes]|nr:uncharacterized protein TNCV_1562941 [Trichonephila clavipes]
MCSGDPLHSLCPLFSHMKGIEGLGIPLRSLWLTLHCRWVAGVSPVNRLVVPLFGSPKRHCYRASAADKGCRVYSLDPRPDVVASYSGCTPGKRRARARAWVFPDDRHTASLVELRGGWREARKKPKAFLDSALAVCPHKSLNSSRGVISETDLLCASEAEILEGFADQSVTQLTQTYAQATKPSPISTTTQTDPNITNILCPPLQYLKPVSSENPMPSTSSSVSTICTSCSSTQENLLPSPSAITPTIQKTETRSLTTPNKFNALSTETQPLDPLPETVPTTSNSEHSNAPEIPQCGK